MGVLQIVVYKPCPGKEAEVLGLIRCHRGVTVAKGLTTKKPSIYMRTSNKEIVEVLEWASTSAISNASHDPLVGGSVWKDFENVCDMVTLSSLPESRQIFPCLERMDVITASGLSSIEEGRYGAIVYRVKPNKEEAFTVAWSEHRAFLEDRGLVTAFEPMIMRSEGGMLLEVFEWRSEEAMMEGSGLNILKPMWSARFQGLCDFLAIDALPEASKTYPVFHPVTLDDPAILQVPTQFSSTSGEASS